MEKKVLHDYEQLSRVTADCIIDFVNDKPTSFLCFAGGTTPLRTYELLVEAHNDEKVSFKDCKFVSLDEWVGLGKNIKGSCHHTLYNKVFKPLSIAEEKICYFNGLASNLENECHRVDDFIFKNGPIDLMLLGIGMNGHIGFNEPGVNPALYSHVIELDQVTKQVSGKYFDEKIDAPLGITLGMKHIMEANKAILIANGEKKADIVKAGLEGEITTDIPASWLQNHRNISLFLDKGAASKLK
ncbi:glucosamine-6-phosphate deaminase [Fredinandcohnia sp. 179-A 10B2 NHS]|uniref:glucosamine-6-phosphate deaminase n=1 Tax=Fredinandcohnia sp. 179-A 10B2 NHS TaxID=3235176 RepID=UPI0039A306F8